MAVRGLATGLAGLLAARAAVGTGADRGGDHRCRAAVARLETDEAALQAGHAIDVAQRRLVGVDRRRRLVQAGDGMVEQLERTIAALQLGGLVGDALLERVIVLGEFVRHQIEGAPDAAELVVAGVVDAHAEIAAGDPPGRFEQAPQRPQHGAVEHEERDAHDQQGDGDRDPENEAQVMDARLGVVLEHGHQGVQLLDERIDLAQQQFDLRRRCRRPVERLDARFQALVPRCAHTAVGGGEQFTRCALDESQQRRMLELGLEIRDRCRHARGLEAAAERIDRDQVGHPLGVPAQAAGDVDHAGAAAGALDHQHRGAHAREADQGERQHGDCNQQHDRAPDDRPGNRDLHRQPPVGRLPDRRRGHTPSTPVSPRNGVALFI